MSVKNCLENLLQSAASRLHMDYQLSPGLVVSDDVLQCMTENFRFHAGQQCAQYVFECIQSTSLRSRSSQHSLLTTLSQEMRLAYSAMLPSRRRACNTGNLQPVGITWIPKIPSNCTLQ